MTHTAVFPPNPKVAMTVHDDWLINVLLSDGRVYTFNTEMWACQSEFDSSKPDNGWPVSVTRKAISDALYLAAINARTWAIDALPETAEQFHAALNLLCEHTSDRDFSTFIRR